MKSTTKQGTPRKRPSRQGEGRPSAYKPRYAQELIDFFDIAPNREVIELTTGKNDYSRETIKEVANDLPTLEGFAAKIGVHRDTLHEWANARYPDDYHDKKLRGILKHEEFSDAIKRAKTLQENILVTNALKGLYNPTFSIFYATNVTKLKNQQHFDHTTKGDKLPAPQVYLPQDLPDSVIDGIKDGGVAEQLA